MLRAIFTTFIVLSLPLVSVAALAIPSPNDLKEAREEARAEADLTAQQEMALWTKWMLIVSGVGTAISIGGVTGLIVSITQTRKALDQARRSNDLTETNYQIETRPWIIVKKVDISGMRTEVAEGGIQVAIRGSITVQNIGKTPAQNLFCKYTIHPSSENEPSEEDRKASISLGPGEVFTDVIGLVELIGDDVVHQAEEAQVLDLVADVFYHDFHRAKEHRTQWQSFLVEPGGDHIQIRRLTGRSWAVLAGEGSHLDIE